ncbi:unnamed protein product [Heligmosomoides polygyrus]|uniref:Transposase n=1 Tax=Heligmosomoides polygyrus TaxID=6339 RepID=A0A183G5H8_HELPZ|nr:unnamed protein product [Heligmosomoides polygyrus]
MSPLLQAGPSGRHPDSVIEAPPVARRVWMHALRNPLPAAAGSRRLKSHLVMDDDHRQHFARLHLDHLDGDRRTACGYLIDRYFDLHIIMLLMS